MFWLKKTIGFWLMPLPFSIALVALGAGLAWRGRRRAGRIFTAAGIAVLLVTSNKAVGNWLAGSLESRYAPVPELTDGAALPSVLGACSYIAVLGGGHADAAGFSANNQLSASALARLVEAVRLWRHLPRAALLTCGPARDGFPAHAEILKRAALDLGVPAAQITELPNVRDTADEVRALRALVGDAPVALVTSAWHMPRAMALAEHAGLRAVPCPADFVCRPQARPEWTDYLWDLRGLERSTKGIHEYLGLWWARLRGQA